MTNLVITRVYADAAGASHFGTDTIDLALAEIAPPAAPMHRSAPMAASRALVLHVEQDWFGAAHPAPARLLQVMVAGTIEVVTSDGERRRFSTGDVFLAEDTTGAGHTTQSIDGPATSVAIQLD